MNIYIEQLLLSNFIIDFCILTIISKLIFQSVKTRRIILSSLFGAVATIIYPFCNHILIINIIKFLVAIIMLQILHPLSTRQLFLSLMLMLGLSYTLGGAVLSNLASVSNGGYKINSFNIWLLIIFCCAVCFISCKIISWTKHKISTNAHIHNISLIYNNTKIDIKSFIDSGNSLYDGNSPVSLINFDTFSRLTNVKLHDYINKQFSTLKDPHFISANTIAGKKNILVFTIDELQLHKNNSINSFKNIKLGVALHFDNTKEYKAILNSSFC